MKKVILDGHAMTDRETTHLYLKKQFRFPEHYGKNLDALYDCLTETEEVTELEFVAVSIMKEQLGDYAEALLKTIEDAIKENQNLQASRKLDGCEEKN